MKGRRAGRQRAISHPPGYILSSQGWAWSNTEPGIPSGLLSSPTDSQDSQERSWIRRGGVKTWLGTLKCDMDISRCFNLLCPGCNLVLLYYKKPYLKSLEVKLRAKIFCVILTTSWKFMGFPLARSASNPIISLQEKKTGCNGTDREFGSFWSLFTENNSNYNDMSFDSYSTVEKHSCVLKFSRGIECGYGKEQTSHSTEMLGMLRCPGSTLGCLDGMCVSIPNASFLLMNTVTGGSCNSHGNSQLISQILGLVSPLWVIFFYYHD